MKLLLNILPAICFFLTYKFSDHNLIYATIAVVISSVITLGGSWFLQGKITRIQIVVILVLFIFAIPTILVKDPDFIKWKVSVVNSVIAVAILLCQFVFKKDIIEALTGCKTPIPESVLKKAAVATAVYFLLCACLNYVIAFRLPEIMNINSDEAENLWVNYKTYGNGILNTVFMIGDSNVDVETAKNAGLHSIGCAWGFRGRTELVAEGADYIAEKPSDIAKIILE